MSKIGKICVYCGSGPGTDPAFVEAARAFGAILAQNGIGLVYGGGNLGIMGELADAVPPTAARRPASSPNSWWRASTPSKASAG